MAEDSIAFAARERVSSTATIALSRKQLSGVRIVNFGRLPFVTGYSLCNSLAALPPGVVSGIEV